MHISQAQLELRTAQMALGSGQIWRSHNIKVHAFQRDAQQFTDVGFVIDDERAWVRHL
jgi:hypothetical protein